MDGGISRMHPVPNHTALRRLLRQADGLSEIDLWRQSYHDAETARARLAEAASQLLELLPWPLRTTPSALDLQRLIDPCVGFGEIEGYGSA